MLGSTADDSNIHRYAVEHVTALEDSGDRTPSPPLSVDLYEMDLDPEWGTQVYIRTCFLARGIDNWAVLIGPYRQELIDLVSES